MTDAKYKTNSKRSPSSISKIEFITKCLLRKKIPGPDSFTGKFYQKFKEELRQIPYKLVQKEEEGILPYFMKPPNLQNQMDITEEENDRPIYLMDTKIFNKILPNQI